MCPADHFFEHNFYNVSSIYLKRTITFQEKRIFSEQQKLHLSLSEKNYEFGFAPNVNFFDDCRGSKCQN